MGQSQPNFKRDRKDLLHLIKRKPVTAYKVAPQFTPVAERSVPMAPPFAYPATPAQMAPMTPYGFPALQHAPPEAASSSAASARSDALAASSSIPEPRAEDLQPYIAELNMLQSELADVSARITSAEGRIWIADQVF